MEDTMYIASDSDYKNNICKNTFLSTYKFMLCTDKIMIPQIIYFQLFEIRLEVIEKKYKRLKKENENLRIELDELKYSISSNVSQR
jgi:hypothetical protein